MYVVTNRSMKRSAKGLDAFGSVPSSRGPNELRIVRVVRKSGHYDVELLRDRLTRQCVRDLSDDYDLALDVDGPWHASLQLACDLFSRARREKKHILVFVHGYNNDVEDVLQTAMELERQYNVIVLPFTWPANGGGALAGTAAYLDDKQDARASAGALNRFIGKLKNHHELLTRGRRKQFMDKAEMRFPQNPERARQYYMQLIDRDCRVSINLLCHSMGNYLLKYALKPGNSALAQLVFDNVSLVAADANNKDHAAWLERVQVRNRVCVVINENDSALKWSRRKPGQQQLARLGHYLKNLVAENTFYIDVTGAGHVGDEHSYFRGKAVRKNSRLAGLFASLFEGGKAETALAYRADINAYVLKG